MHAMRSAATAIAVSDTAAVIPSVWMDGWGNGAMRTTTKPASANAVMAVMACVKEVERKERPRPRMMAARA